MSRVRPSAGQRRVDRPGQPPRRVATTWRAAAKASGVIRLREQRMAGARDADEGVAEQASAPSSSGPCSPSTPMSRSTSALAQRPRVLVGLRREAQPRARAPAPPPPRRSRAAKISTKPSLARIVKMRSIVATSRLGAGRRAACAACAAARTAARSASACGVSAMPRPGAGEQRVAGGGAQPRQRAAHRRGTEPQPPRRRRRRWPPPAGRRARQQVRDRGGA